MMTHSELIGKLLKKPGVRAAYAAQAEEFALLDELLRARRRLDPRCGTPQDRKHWE